ncbi:MAG: hypothetical protein ACRCRR_00085, partial [Rickettsia sp.]
MIIHLTLPLPSYELSPNAMKGKHYKSSQNARVSNRESGYYLAKQFIAKNGNFEIIKEKKAKKDKIIYPTQLYELLVFYRVANRW